MHTHENPAVVPVSAPATALDGYPTPDGRHRPEQVAVIPRGYLVGFLDLLAEYRDVVRVITYDDLPWGDDYDHEHHFPRERERWTQSLERGERDPSAIYLILQHDVDAAPDRTMAVLAEQERRGLRSNVMIFRRRLYREHLKELGEVVEREYKLDIPHLQHFERQGFVIGYHANAYEQANFDTGRAERIFLEDVAALREQFTIRFFCPHGGVRDSEGRSNAALELPAALRGDLRWVLNRYGPRFDGTYSDGALRSTTRDPSDRDLRDFVKTWRPGGRYRILVHPQYYADDAIEPAGRLPEAAWYREIIDHYARGRAGDDPWREAAQSLERCRAARQG
jgi:hypothetical protein